MALKKATAADKPSIGFDDIIKQLEEKNREKNQRTSGSFGKNYFEEFGANELDTTSEKEKRNSSKSPGRKTSILDVTQRTLESNTNSKTKTLPRNFSASDFS